MHILRLESLGRRFGSLRAVNDVSLDVNRGEVLALIGPNGAGKSTLVNVVSGLDRGGTGRVWFKDQEITRMPAHRRARAGIGRTFQLVKLIRGLSILENVMSGSYRLAKSNVAAITVGHSSASAEEAEIADRACQKLDFVGLGHIDPWLECDALPYGQQRLVEIARALAAEPEILLLDEPAAGLNTSEALALQGLIRQIRDAGTTIFLIEHNMRLVSAVSDRCFVLHLGARLAEGTFAEVSRDPVVREAYLGVGSADA